MVKGYNRELAINASCKVLGIDKLQNSKFDEEGNVIRDYTSELDVYVKHEEHFVLPYKEIKYFDGHIHYKKFVESQPKTFTPIVKLRPLAVLPEVEKKTSVLELFAIGVNYIYSKFKKPTKDELIPKKGYYWIYNQIMTADSSCKRKLAS